MVSCYTHLDLAERRCLAKWREAKIPMKEIAVRLGRAPSSLYREIKRNYFRDAELPQLDGYHGVAAQRMADERRATHRKLVADPALRTVVTERLREGWSPEQIAGRLRIDPRPGRVSHETIYRYAYSREGLADGLYRHLPERRRRRRPRIARRRHGKRFPEAMSIAQRPAIVARRREFGHWECDLVLFRREFGKPNISMLVERVSRFAMALRNDDRQSRPVMEAVADALSTLPSEARQSVTFDRGTEFTAWAHLQELLDVEPWFCDPKSPWQKGTVENTNGRIRRYLPRHADPTALTNRYLKSICERLNATPRKCLGFRTPAEVFRNRLFETGGSVN